MHKLGIITKTDRKTSDPQLICHLNDIGRSANIVRDKEFKPANQTLENNSVWSIKIHKTQRGGHQFRGSVQKNQVPLLFWSPVNLHFAKICIFSQNHILSSVLSVLSCYITCIAHSFHIYGI